MRLALTHAFCWPEVRRGAERMLHELGHALAARGHQVTVLTSSWSAGRERDGDVKVVRIRRRHESDASHEVDFGRRVLPHLVAGRFDAVHSLGAWDARASVWAARVHPRRRTVYTNLGLPLRSWCDRQPSGDAHLQVVARVDVYGCMSAYALDLLERDYGRSGALTPGGVRLDEFRPAPSREPHPTLLFSGAVAEPRKGLATLLEALGLLARHEPSVRLWVSGPGDPMPLLERASPDVRARVDVLPIGAPGDQPARYGRAWATVLPSVGDSFGMALLESLACGTPIVASTDGAPHELVAPGTGATVAPEDPAGLAEACAQALALAREAGTAECCRAAAAPYDWDTGLAPRFEALYEG